MMVSASPSMVARSSLEEMLDSLRRRDEAEKPKEVPPALPSRPTSKARLPSARRSLPNNFSVEKLDKSPEWAPSPSVNKRKERDSVGGKRCNFGVKRTEKDVDSPYIASESVEELPSRQKVAKSDCDDNVGYFIKKKPLGLLLLLEEESSFPEATDLTLADKFKQQLKENSCFKAERRGFFSIHHHAGEN
ncbi:hypothetical protein ACLB2K_032067 [Fragaria x ananassa]